MLYLLLHCIHFVLSSFAVPLSNIVACLLLAGCPHFIIVITTITTGATFLATASISFTSTATICAVGILLGHGQVFIRAVVKHFKVRLVQSVELLNKADIHL